MNMKICIYGKNDILGYTNFLMPFSIRVPIPPRMLSHKIEALCSYYGT